MDNFPDDQARVTRRLQRDVAQAQGSAARRPPLLEASAGWIFTDRATPPTPATGKTHIYSQGGRLWASSTAGAVPLLLPDFPQADYVPNPGSFIVSSAPGSYNPGWGQDLRDAVANLHSTVTAALNAFKASGQMDSF
ncbi:hypothetical protein AB0J63_17610 [Streptosporangium canum]|uniref:hypothetical protein n=1 Tax=Streptosporangium canum TaxID=324952 RepID=UPI00342B8FC3